MRQTKGKTQTIKVKTRSKTYQVEVRQIGHRTIWQEYMLDCFLNESTPSFKDFLIWQEDNNRIPDKTYLNSILGNEEVTDID